MSITSLISVYPIISRDKVHGSSVKLFVNIVLYAGAVRKNCHIVNTEYLTAGTIEDRYHLLNLEGKCH